MTAIIPPDEQLYMTAEADDLVVIDHTAPKSTQQTMWGPTRWVTTRSMLTGIRRRYPESLLTRYDPDDKQPPRHIFTNADR